MGCFDLHGASTGHQALDPVLEGGDLVSTTTGSPKEPSMPASGRSNVEFAPALQNVWQILACFIAYLQSGCPSLDSSDVDADLTCQIRNGGGPREWIRFTKSRVVVTRPRSIMAIIFLWRFSSTEESLFYSQASAMHYELSGLRIAGWIPFKGVAFMCGGAMLGMVFALWGAKIICYDNGLGSMNFLEHERIFDIPRSDFDVMYRAAQQVQAKNATVTMTELKEITDDVQPDTLLEKVSAALHILLEALKDPEAFALVENVITIFRSSQFPASKTSGDSGTTSLTTTDLETGRTRADKNSI